MSKFGEIIDVSIPVLLDFYSEWSEESATMNPVLLDVAAAMGEKAKIIKINTDKNPELTEALRVKTLPTLIIYKNGEMVWRQSGEIDTQALLDHLQEFV